MQNEDPEKMNIYMQRLKTEFNKHAKDLFSEDVTRKMLYEIERILMFLNYSYDSIPSFNADEYKSILYLFIKFIVDNHLLGDALDPNDASKHIETLNCHGYNNILYEQMVIQKAVK
mmetsp:Transcript_26277/g.30389  ORF Transcript_26277/g.30389 Transcript_26277/m.30389 type:complete len:116 (+) Transcript_26277:968-1315(+)